MASQEGSRGLVLKTVMTRREDPPPEAEALPDPVSFLGWGEAALVVVLLGGEQVTGFTGQTQPEVSHVQDLLETVLPST